MERVEGMTAFITGGARGIGLGIARAFARAGVKLAIADVDPDSWRPRSPNSRDSPRSRHSTSTCETVRLTRALPTKLGPGLDPVQQRRRCCSDPSYLRILGLDARNQPERRN